MRAITRKEDDGESVVEVKTRNSLEFSGLPAYRLRFIVVATAALICAMAAIAACMFFSAAMGAWAVIGIAAASLTAIIAIVPDVYNMYQYIKEKKIERKISNFVERVNKEGRCYMAIVAEPYMSIRDTGANKSAYGNGIVRVIEKAIRLSGEESGIELMHDIAGRREMCKVGDMVYEVKGIRYFTENQKEEYIRYAEKNQLKDGQRRFVLECSIKGSVVLRPIETYCVSKEIAGRRVEVPIKGSVEPLFWINTNSRDALISFVLGRYDRSLGIINNFLTIASYIEYHCGVIHGSGQLPVWGSGEYRKMCESGLAADLIEYREEFEELLPSLPIPYQVILIDMLKCVEGKGMLDLPETQRVGTEKGILRSICAMTVPDCRMDSTACYKNKEDVGLISRFVASKSFRERMLGNVFSGVLMQVEHGALCQEVSEACRAAVPSICTHIPGFDRTVRTFVGAVSGHEVLQKVGDCDPCLINLAIRPEVACVIEDDENMERYNTTTLEPRLKILRHFDGDLLKTAIVIVESEIKKKPLLECLEDEKLQDIVYCASDSDLVKYFEALLNGLWKSKRYEERDDAIVEDVISFITACALKTRYSNEIRDGCAEETHERWTIQAAKDNAYALLHERATEELFADRILKRESCLGFYLPCSRIEHVRLLRDDDLAKDAVGGDRGSSAYSAVDADQTIPKEVFSPSIAQDKGREKRDSKDSASRVRYKAASSDFGSSATPQRNAIVEHRMHDIDVRVRDDDTEEALLSIRARVASLQIMIVKSSPREIRNCNSGRKIDGAAIGTVLMIVDNVVAVINKYISISEEIREIDRVGREIVSKGGTIRSSTGENQEIYVQSTLYHIKEWEHPTARIDRIGILQCYNDGREDEEHINVLNTIVAIAHYQRIRMMREYVDKLGDESSILCADSGMRDDDERSQLAIEINEMKKRLEGLHHEVSWVLYHIGIRESNISTNRDLEYSVRLWVGYLKVLAERTGAYSYAPKVVVRDMPESGTGEESVVQSIDSDSSVPSSDIDFSALLSMGERISRA